MALIFIASTDLLSTRQTSRIIGPFLRWLRPGISEEQIAATQFVVRKCGHAAGYGVLALLLWRARRKPVPDDPRPWSWADARWALGVAVMYAVTDEIHQGFVASREGSPWDVLLDGVGAALALALLWRLGRWRTERRTC
jgi:VanZ family protein